MENEPKKNIEIRFHGPAAEHNLLCWICNDAPAVYNMDPNWVFEPCWECQKGIGGKVYRVRNRFIKWLISSSN